MADDITLREWIEQLVQSERDAREIHQKVVDERLKRMNELREQITSERGMLVNRELFDTKLATYETRIADLEKSRWIAFGILLALQIGFATIIGWLHR